MENPENNNAPRDFEHEAGMSGVPDSDNRGRSERKPCPYCGELIMTSARKCRFCGEWLDNLRPAETISAAEDDDRAEEKTIQVVEEVIITPSGTEIVADEIIVEEQPATPMPPMVSEILDEHQPPTPPEIPFVPAPPVPPVSPGDETVSPEPFPGSCADDSDEPSESWLKAYMLRPFVFKYFNFTGYDTRKQFWMSYLMLSITAMGLGGLMLLLTVTSGLTGLIVGLSIYAFFSLYMLIPSLAMTVRRLRDADYSWAGIFWPLLPVAGPIVLLVILCRRTTVNPFMPRVVATPRRTSMHWADGLYIVACIVVNVIAFVMTINIVQRHVTYYSNFYNIVTDVVQYGPDVIDYFSADDDTVVDEIFDFDDSSENDFSDGIAEEQDDAAIEAIESWIEQTVWYLDNKSVWNNTDLPDNAVYQSLWFDMNQFNMSALYYNYNFLESSVNFRKVQHIAELCIVNGWEPQDFAINGMWNNDDPTDHTITVDNYVAWIKRKCE